MGPAAAFRRHCRRCPPPNGDSGRLYPRPRAGSRPARPCAGSGGPVPRDDQPALAQQGDCRGEPECRRRPGVAVGIRHRPSRAMPEPGPGCRAAPVVVGSSGLPGRERPSLRPRGPDIVSGGRRAGDVAGRVHPAGAARGSARCARIGTLRDTKQYPCAPDAGRRSGVGGVGEGPGPAGAGPGAGCGRPLPSPGAIRPVDTSSGAVGLVFDDDVVLEPPRTGTCVRGRSNGHAFSAVLAPPRPSAVAAKILKISRARL